MDEGELVVVDKMVIVDSSPLIALAIVEGLLWLPEMFGSVYLPESVQNEVLPGRGATGEAAISQALDMGWLTLWTSEIPTLIDVDLDPGEFDCINLAMHYKDNSLLIMDERAGRAVAKEQGLRITGTAALIGFAKKTCLISSARTAFEKLHTHDYRIAPAIIREILTSVNEL